MKHCFLFLLLCFTAISLTHPLDSPCTETENYKWVHHLDIGSFQYKMKYNAETDSGKFEILRRGKPIFSRKGSHFFINPSPHSCGLPAAGHSLTKKNRRELVVMDWSGGAHCCYTLYIIALEEQPFIIQKMDLEHTGEPIFRDLTGDGIPEIVTEDWTFAYWKVSFAQSPAPEVILSYNGTKWAFDPKLNMKPFPLRADFLGSKNNIIQNFKKVPVDASLGDTGDTGAPVLLWEEMLKLIYSGNADLAFHLVDATWPPHNSSKNKFLREFCSQLSQSPFLDDLKKINRNALNCG